jgi:hypothetical protein
MAQRRKRDGKPARRRPKDAAQRPAAPRRGAKPPAAPASPSEEELQGPPPGEATMMRSDREREQAERYAEHTASSPALSGGDVDADWERADSAGEEAVGGTVATPDQDVVDEMGDALGVPRAPEDEVRTSQEILEDRDRHRREQEE